MYYLEYFSYGIKNMLCCVVTLFLQTHMSLLPRFYSVCLCCVCISIEQTYFLCCLSCMFFFNTTLCHLTIYFYFLISMNAFWLSSVAYIHCVWVDCCIVFLYDIFLSWYVLNIFLCSIHMQVFDLISLQKTTILPIKLQHTLLFPLEQRTWDDY